MTATQKKGRGSQINPHNRFNKLTRVHLSDLEDEAPVPINKTKLIETFPKTIINKINSPDIPFRYSINPYQGCEHGCSYCFARPTHNYWGYSSGTDFEQKILIKKNAPALLSKTLRKKNWKVAPVMISGNTDPYQPVEKRFELTRQLLKIFLDYRHPVSIITKNAMVLRDLDILKSLAEKDLVSVCFSINTLNDRLRRKLEPRTSTINKRLKAISTLIENGIPVHILIAPIIPGLNDHEVIPLVKELSARNVFNISHIPIRLNDDLEEIFTSWLKDNFPSKEKKVLNLIRSCREGKLGEKRFGKRMKGTGPYADHIREQFDKAMKIFFKPREIKPYNLELFSPGGSRQMSLF
jgi:DNA repair photolyase